MPIFQILNYTPNTKKPKLREQLFEWYEQHQQEPVKLNENEAKCKFETHKAYSNAAKYSTITFINYQRFFNQINLYYSTVKFKPRIIKAFKLYLQSQYF